jgi:DNA polymerase-3 subunit gamma/tau
MLSQSAFNAFLKTLEEPPAHAIFILATTEKHKIIPTILSRCQIFDFNRIRVEDAVAYLKKIADKEHLEYEEDALHVIGQKADGAMRDALSIFDQVVSFSGGKITYRDVIDNLNILDYEYYFKLTFSLLEGDVPSAMLLFDEVLARGFDARNFINGYAAHLRDLMVCKNPETIQLMEVGAGIKEKYLSQADQVSLSFLYDGLDICNQADIQFRGSRNQRLTIELALVKLARLSADSKKKTLTEPESRSVPETVPDRSQAAAQESASPQAGLSQEQKTTEKSGGVAGAQKPASQQSGTSQDENGNGASSVVRSHGISIRESLKHAPETPVKGEVADAMEETESPEGGEQSAADPKAVLQAWKEYADSMEKKKPRIHSTLVHNMPEVRPDGSVMVVLNSEAQRDHFIKNIKHELVAYILKATGLDSLEVLTEVSDHEQAGKKIYTEQDKLAFLLKKNPELGKLKMRFNLDFDD